MTEVFRLETPWGGRRTQGLSIRRIYPTDTLALVFRTFTSAAALSLLILAVATQSACLGPRGEVSSIRTAVVAGLVASGGGGITTHQAATFQADIRGSWAIAYDPADPLGCRPGGLWGTRDAPSLSERPCVAYVLVRRKSRWAVIAAGQPGAFVPPERAPEDLGNPSRLVYLAP